MNKMKNIYTGYLPFELELISKNYIKDAGCLVRLVSPLTV
jgi:hypothetical protein